MAVEETAPPPPPAEDSTPKSEEPAPAAAPEEPVKEAEAKPEEAAAAAAASEEKKEGEAGESKDESPAAAAAPAKPAPKPKPTKEELEKKALEEFKLKVEEAIKKKEFELPPPPPPKEEETKPEEPKAEETKAEEAPAATTTEEPKKEDEAPKTVEKKEEEPKKEPEPEPVAEPSAAAPGPEEKKEEEPAKTEEVIEEETPAEDVFLWGIPLLHTANDERTDVILNKFLRARDFKVNQALEMLKSTILWRKSYKADEILEEDLGTDFDGLAFMFGVDKEGHPVCYNVFGVLQDKELYQKVFRDDASKFVRWRVQLLEKAIKQLKFEPGSPNALLQVIDLKNMPWPAKKVRSILLGNAISLLQDNYPELVTRTVFVNVPWYYSAFFSLVSPFLTQHQKSKFIVSRLGKSTEALLKFISPEQVPVQYGGFGRPSDEEFSGAETPATEVTIKPGEKKTVDFSVTTSGATVTWDVSVVGSDVSYGAEFHPDQEGSYTTIIEKTKKITAQLEEPIRSSFKTSEPGKIVLIIDNSVSKKKKLVVYRHIVKGASSAAPEAAPPAAELDA